MSAALGPRLRRRLLLLCLLGWVLRVAVAVDYEAHHPLAGSPVVDERAYERRALEIAGGDVLGHEVFFQEPLYAYALAAVFAATGPPAAPDVASERQRTAARHAQAFLGALLVAGVFLLALRAFGPAAATVAGLAAATYRPLLLFPSLLLKPNLFLPILVALALAVATAPLARLDRRALARWLAAGLLAGAGALLRGNVLVLLPVLVAWPLVRARLEGRRSRVGLGAACALALGTALVLVPVALRNRLVGGELVLTTSGAGTNLYGGNNPSNPEGRATELPWVRGIPEYEAGDWRREAERRVGHPLDAAGTSRYWLRETLASVRARPWLHLRILWNKLRLTLGAYEVPDNHHLDWDAAHVPLLRVPWPGFALWGWLGLAGALAFALGRPGRERGGGGVAWSTLALLVLYLGTIVLTVTSMRVRLGVAVLLLPFAGWLATALAGRVPALAGLARWLAAGTEEPPAAPAPPAPSGRVALAALAVSLLAVFVPAVPAAERAEDLDERDYNLAVHLLSRAGGEEELGRVERIAAELAARHPGTSRVETLLADVDYRRAVRLRTSGEADTPAGREARRALLDGALKRLRDVVRAPGVGPRERFRARAVAGLCQLEAGDGPAAEGHLRRALEFDPSDRRLRFALANALYLGAEDEERGRAERLTEARELLRGLLDEADDPGVAHRLEAVEAALARGS